MRGGCSRYLVVVVCVSLLGACGGVGTGPNEVTLEELTVEQESYDGQLVTARGVVRTFDDPRHYWIEDVDLNRVEIVPQEEISPYLGEEVRVVGRFTFRNDEGRRITVEEVEVVAEGS